MPIQELERDYQPLTPHKVEMMPGLGEDSCLTEETGFALWMEVKRFFNDLNFTLSLGKDLVEALILATNELEVNIRSYNVEFIKSKTVLPHKNRFNFVDGVQRMVGNNGRPLLDAISPIERNGAVLEASRVIDSSLASAPLNSFAVMMNPDGWSGYVDKNGASHNHLNAETMVFWKDQNGILKGLTLVTDLNQAQTAEVMKLLGVSEQALNGNSQQEKVANIVRNPAILRLQTSPFEYVLDRILAVRGQQDFRLLQKDGTEEIRSVEQTRQDIKDFDKLLQFDQQEEQCITSLREFIMGKVYHINDIAAQQAIAKEIERTVLTLAREHLSKNVTAWKSPGIYKPTVIQYSHLPAFDNFELEIAFLKSRAGCPSAGGISGSKILTGISLGQNIAIGDSFGFTGESGKKGKTCISCGEVNYCTKRCYKCEGVLV